MKTPAVPEETASAPDKRDYTLDATLAALLVFAAVCAGLLFKVAL